MTGGVANFHGSRDGFYNYAGAVMNVTGGKLTTTATSPEGTGNMTNNGGLIDIGGTAEADIDPALDRYAVGNIQLYPPYWKVPVLIAASGYAGVATEVTVTGTNLTSTWAVPSAAQPALGNISTAENVKAVLIDGGIEAMISELSDTPGTSFKFTVPTTLSVGVHNVYIKFQLGKSGEQVGYLTKKIGTFEVLAALEEGRTEPDLPAAKPIEDIAASAEGSVFIWSTPRSSDPKWLSSNVIDESSRTAVNLYPGTRVVSAVTLTSAIVSGSASSVTFTGALSDLSIPVINSLPAIAVGELNLIYVHVSNAEAVPTRAIAGSWAIYREESSLKNLYVYLVDIARELLGGGSPSTAQVSIGGTVVGTASKSVALYDHPVDLIPDNGVPSLNYAGYFLLGGYYPTDGELYYRLSEDATYKQFYPNSGLLNSEIARLANGELLYITLAKSDFDHVVVYVPKTYESEHSNRPYSITEADADITSLSNAVGDVLSGSISFTATVAMPGGVFELVPEGAGSENIIVTDTTGEGLEAVVSLVGASAPLSYTITVTGITSSFYASLSYTPPVPTLNVVASTDGLSIDPSGSREVELGSTSDYTVTVGSPITELPGYVASNYTLEFDVQAYRTRTGGAIEEVDASGVVVSILSSSGNGYSIRVTLPAELGYADYIRVRVYYVLTGAEPNVSVRTDAAGLTIESGKAIGKALDESYSFEVTVSADLQASVESGAVVSYVYLLNNTHSEAIATCDPVSGRPGVYLVTVTGITEDVIVNVFYQTVYPTYTYTATITNSEGLSIYEWDYNTGIYSGEAYNGQTTLFVWIDAPYRHPEGVFTLTYRGPNTVFENPSYRVSPNATLGWYNIDITGIRFNGLSIEITYTVPSAPPVIVGPVEPELPPAIPIEEVEESEKGSTVIVATSRDKDLNWDKNFVVDDSANDIVKLVPGTQVSTSLKPSVSIASGSSGVIRFSGALSGVITQIPVTNALPAVSVNESLKVVYIFVSSTLTGRGVSLRSVEDSWAVYARDESGINTLYIYLVDIDRSVLGDESSVAELSVQNIAGGEYALVGTTEKSITLHDHPIDLIIDNGVPSVNNAGYFTLTGEWTVGELYYRIGDEKYRPYAGSLTNSEIYRLASGELLYLTVSKSDFDKVIVYIPKTFNDLNIGGGVIPLTRAVTIRSTSGVTISSGLTVDGTFTFTYTPVEILPAGEFTFTYTKDGIVISTPPVLIESSPIPVDGVFTFTLTSIKVSDLVVTLDYRTSTGTSIIPSPTVWSTDGTLYISSPITGTAKVYNLAGALVTTVSYGADITSVTSLRAGIYIIVLGDGSRYKAIISK
jgi:hypothetical protein